MARILSIDYGRKRVGIAVSDPLQIIAGGLTTIHAKDIFDFLDEYIAKEDVEKIVVGYPKTLRNEASEAIIYINPFIKKLIKKYPDIEVDIYDERFTSKLAVRAMIDGGMKKKDRQNKANTDKISATIILQSYMEYLKNKITI